MSGARSSPLDGISIFQTRSDWLGVPLVRSRSSPGPRSTGPSAVRGRRSCWRRDNAGSCCSVGRAGQAARGAHRTRAADRSTRAAPKVLWQCWNRHQPVSMAVCAENDQRGGDPSEDPRCSQRIHTALRTRATARTRASLRTRAAQTTHPALMRFALCGFRKITRVV